MAKSQARKGTKPRRTRRSGIDPAMGVAFLVALILSVGVAGLVVVELRRGQSTEPTQPLAHVEPDPQPAPAITYPPEPIPSSPPPAPPTPPTPPAPRHPPAPSALDSGGPRSAVVAMNVPAGRSPYPQPGESFSSLIDAPRLSNQEQVPRTRSDAVAADTLVPWQEAKNHLHQQIIAEGRVVVTKNLGNLCFLNFDADWRGKFYVVVFQDVFPALPGPPEVYFLNKTVRIAGKVVMHRDTPQIQVRSVSQIVSVE